MKADTTKCDGSEIGRESVQGTLEIPTDSLQYQLYNDSDIQTNKATSKTATLVGNEVIPAIPQHV